MMLGDWGLWEVLIYEGEALRNGTSALIKEARRSFVAPPTL